MLRLRPYKSCDAETIVSWIKDEYAFRQWCADRYDHYPITASDINDQYNSHSEDDWFYPMTAFDESGVVGHMIMRFTDDAKSVLRFGFIIVDVAKRNHGYGKEMLHLALRFAFGILKARMITLGVFENNPAAYHCYRSAGFREAQMEPGYYHVMGEAWKCIEMEYDPDVVRLELQDTEWPFEFTDHDRTIVRAIVFDDTGFFYFVRAERDDEFGRATLIETSGGGVEEGEDLIAAIKRELKEELGADVEVICKLGIVSDYYNLIGDMYLHGLYVTKNEKEAFYIFMRCIETMTDEAAYRVAGPVYLRLGRMFLDGSGTERNLKNALICFQKAESFLYDMVLDGEVMYRKSLNAAIKGQQETREKLSEQLPVNQWKFDG